MANQTTNKEREQYLFVLEGVKSVLERVTLNQESFTVRAIHSAYMSSLTEAIEVMRAVIDGREVEKLPREDGDRAIFGVACFKNFHRREKYGCLKGKYAGIEQTTAHIFGEDREVKAIREYGCEDCNNAKCPEKDGDIFYEAMAEAVELLNRKYSL